MSFRPEEVSAVLAQELERYEAKLETKSVGTVLSVGDGIARVWGLEDAMAGELLKFPGDVMGMVLNLEEDNVGAVLFGSDKNIKEGDRVERTGRIASVPVGKAMIGRVVNAIGQPVDGKGPIGSDKFRNIEFKAPGVIERQPVKEPLQTGIKAIDSMIPIGRGQRELIIGDRQTGKTAIALDTIINQKGTGRHLHLRRDRAEGVDGRERGRRSLEKHGAMEYTIVVTASASESAPLQYIAPYAGCAMGEEFTLQGRPRAVRLRRPVEARHAYRQLSLLLRRPPGREAYPGDVFYLHSRLLERAVQALRREGRRLAHRAAVHRDPGRRRLGVHPDQRHLDHRRPDLPRGRPLLRGRAPRDQRRHLGVARRRQRADQGDAPGRRDACASTSRSTARSRRSPSSAPTSTRRRRRSSRAASAWSSCSSRASSCRCRSSSR